jgi:dTDP-4-dehydrorhamnose reductase
VIHAAAMTNVNACETERDRAFAVHVDGTRLLRDATRERGARFLYISTVSIFPGLVGDAKENELPYPKNWYNITKYLGEVVALEDPQSVIVRLNLIGVHPEGSRGMNFCEWLVDSAKKNTDLKLFTDVRINPLSNWTIAEMLGSLLKNDCSQRIVHLASRDLASKADVAQMVLRQFPSYSGHVDRISIDEIPSNVERPKEMWLNTDATREATGLTFPSLEEEIHRITHSSPFV